MAKIYYARIKHDPDFTINDVSTLWRNQVQALLDADQTG